MVRSLNSGISGMQQSQQRMDIIGNNIANVNTTGYKSARVDYADTFSQTLRASSASSGTSGNIASMQVGTGVTTEAIKNQYTQGALARTSVPTDLAISGDGFFVVRDTITSSNYVTRSGDFHIDSSGFLVTNSGMRLQGYSSGTSGTIGDLQINATGAPASATSTTVSSYSIDREGVISVRLDDGTEFRRAQILLQKFNDPQSLMKEGNNLYSGIDAAGPLTSGGVTTAAAPGTSGLGEIEAGAIELSNVDLATEFASLITTQRAFQANARVISTSDEILQELVSLKR